MSSRPLPVLAIFGAAMLEAGAGGAQQPAASNPLDVVPDKMPFDIPYGAPISLEHANGVIAAAVAEAQKHDWKLNVAVVDSGGNLVAFQRMDGAIWASAYGSQGKAVASSAFARPSGVMQERATQPTPAGINAASGGLMIMGQGAVPLFRNGNLVGAVGVGGGTSQEDEDCAAAGAAAL